MTESFAGIAIHLGEEFVGMCGLANRAGGYDAALLESLKPLVDAAAQMIGVMRVSRSTTRSPKCRR